MKHVESYHIVTWMDNFYIVNSLNTVIAKCSNSFQAEGIVIALEGKISHPVIVWIESEYKLLTRKNRTQFEDGQLYELKVVAGKLGLILPPIEREK